MQLAEDADLVVSGIAVSMGPGAPACSDTGLAVQEGAQPDQSQVLLFWVQVRSCMKVAAGQAMLLTCRHGLLGCVLTGRPRNCTLCVCVLLAVCAQRRSGVQTER